MLDTSHKYFKSDKKLHCSHSSENVSSHSYRNVLLHDITDCAHHVTRMTSWVWRDSPLALVAALAAVAAEIREHSDQLRCSSFLLEGIV